MSDPTITEATPEEVVQIEKTVGGEDLSGTWHVVTGDA